MNVGLALLVGYLALVAIAITVNHHLMPRHETREQADAEQYAALTKP